MLGVGVDTIGAETVTGVEMIEAVEGVGVDMIGASEVFGMDVIGVIEGVGLDMIGADMKTQSFSSITLSFFSLAKLSVYGNVYGVDANVCIDFDGGTEF